MTKKLESLARSALVATTGGAGGRAYINQSPGYLVWTFNRTGTIRGTFGIQPGLEPGDGFGR